MMPRKRAWVRWNTCLCLVIAGGALGCGRAQAASSDPFDLPGPAFLQLYITMLIIALGVALALRALVRGFPAAETTRRLE